MRVLLWATALLVTAVGAVRHEGRKLRGRNLQSYTVGLGNQSVVLPGVATYSSLYLLQGTNSKSLPVGSTASIIGGLQPLLGNTSTASSSSVTANFVVFVLSDTGLQTMVSAVSGLPSRLPRGKVLSVSSSAMTAFIKSTAVNPSLLLHSKIMNAAANGLIDTSFTPLNATDGLNWGIWWYQAWPLSVTNLQALTSAGFTSPPISTTRLPASYSVASAAFVSLPDVATTSSRATVAYTAGAVTGIVPLDLWATDSIRFDMGQQTGRYAIQGDRLVAVNLTMAEPNPPFVKHTVQGGKGSASFDLGDAVPPGLVWLAVNEQAYAITVTQFDVYY